MKKIRHVSDDIYICIHEICCKSKYKSIQLKYGLISGLLGLGGGLCSAECYSSFRSEWISSENIDVSWTAGGCES